MQYVTMECRKQRDGPGQDGAKFSSAMQTWLTFCRIFRVRLRGLRFISRTCTSGAVPKGIFSFQHFASIGIFPSMFEILCIESVAEEWVRKATRSLTPIEQEFHVIRVPVAELNSAIDSVFLQDCAPSLAGHFCFHQMLTWVHDNDMGLDWCL